MVTVERLVGAAPADVWAVLSDGWQYTWVVGTAFIRDVDATWPREGARIHHSVGVWPLLLSDDTEVLSVEPERRLVLQARGWPLGEARVVLELEPVDDGCLLRLIEDAWTGPGRFVPAPLRHPLLRARNGASAQRLALRAEGMRANANARGGSAGKDAATGDGPTGDGPTG
jgi:hypothetical protein